MSATAIMQILTRAKPAIAAHWSSVLDAQLPGFSPEVTQQIDRTLVNYFAEISSEQVIGRKMSIVAAMKALFAALDVINDNADGAVLETDERELLVPIIIDGAVAAGLDIDEFEDGDPTLQFRNF